MIHVCVLISNSNVSSINRVLVGKPEGKSPIGRPRRRWEDNIKMDLQEVECWAMEWIELSQDRNRWRALVKAVMNIWGNFLTS
jgi:hypothetical protein